MNNNYKNALRRARYAKEKMDREYRNILEDYNAKLEVFTDEWPPHIAVLSPRAIELKELLPDHLIRIDIYFLKTKL